MPSTDLDLRHLGIPVRDKRRGTIIGFCRQPPFGQRVQLAIYRASKLTPAACGSDDDQLSIVRVDLAYDTRAGCYWADDYRCLASSLIEPY